MNVYFKTICYGFYFFKGERREFLGARFLPDPKQFSPLKRLSFAWVVINHRAVGEKGTTRGHWTKS